MMKLSQMLLTICCLLSSSLLIGQEIEAPPPPPPPPPPPAPVIDEIFQVVEEMPLFPGCDAASNRQLRKECAQKKMMDFVAENLNYPEQAKAEGVEGVAVIRFVVDRDGSIKSPTIVRNIGSGCGEEALRIVEQMPNWIPGKQRGRPVKVYFNLPIKFKLNNGGEKVMTESPPPPPPPPALAVPEREVFQVVEQMPQFVGCESEPDKYKRQECAQQKMLEFVYKNLQYPPEARENGVEGVVVIRFIIEKDGSITNAKIVRDIGGGCGAAAMAVVQKMPKWNSGQQRGKPVAVYFNLPIKFKLEKKARRRG